MLPYILLKLCDGGTNHYGQVQINLVRPKSFWTDQNCFGHIEGQGIKRLCRTTYKLVTVQKEYVARICFLLTVY